jgi:hypothetical protein
MGLGDAMTAKKKVDVPAGEAKPKESARQRAVKLARTRCELWHTVQNGPKQGFASFQVDGHTEHVELRGTAGRLWLGGLVYKETGEALGRQDLEGAIENLEAAAIFEGPELPVALRVADLGDRTYLDLADKAWRVVEVTAEGWRVIPGHLAPVRFRRPNGTEALPVPVPGGNLEDLGRFIHTNKDGLSLAAAWMVAALTDRGPAPVASLAGRQGSAKSSATRVFQRLVDPRGGSLRARPKNDEDLAVAARNSWVVSFDNLSRIREDLSDGFCRLSTGASFATRTLFTNGEETIFAARRPVILNSIVDVVSRPDLMDRTVTVQLEKISEERRIEEGEFWPLFEKALPGILGAALTALAGALSRWSTTRPTRKPRMADFYRLALAAGPDLPGGAETFEKAWEAMRDAAVSSALECAPIGTTLLEILEAQGKWKKPARELLQTLNAARPTGPTEDGWPQTPQGLVAALKRLAPALEAEGWHVELGLKDTTKKHGRLVVIAPIERMEERVRELVFVDEMTEAEAERQAALEAAS